MDDQPIHRDFLGRMQRCPQLITSIGVGFLLFGVFLFLVTAASYGSIIFLTLGLIVFAMGLILTFGGLSSDPDDSRQCSQDAIDSGSPLSYLQSEVERSSADYMVKC